MSRTGRRRRLRLVGVGVSALVLAFGLALVVNVAGHAPGAAANLSATLQVYVSGNQGTVGEVQRFSLDAVLAGAASSDSTLSSANTAMGPLAVDRSAANAILGSGPFASGGGAAPQVGVVSVASGTEKAKGTAKSPDAVVADPTNPSIAYVLEGNGSGGQIDRVNISSSPPTDTLLATGSEFAANICCSLTSMAITPDGQTLLVGEEGDGFVDVGVVPVGQPTHSFEWTPPSNTVSLDVISDLAMAPNGTTLYIAGSGFTTTEATEGAVLAVPTPKSASQTAAWVLALAQMSNPTCLTVTPDGSTVAVAGTDGPSSASLVQKVLASGAPAGSRQVPLRANPNGSEGLTSIAVTPDGANLLVAGIDGSTSSAAIYPLQTGNLALGALTALPVRFSQNVPESLAITPDQAAATFGPSVAAAGQASSFIANALPPGEFGPVSYTWTFGDGQTATVSGPTVSHVYAAPGTYSVGLTESTPDGFRLSPALVVDGAGQTPSWLANLGATRVITVPATPTTSSTSTTTTTTSSSSPTSSTSSTSSTAPTSSTSPGPSTSVTSTPGQPAPGTPVLTLNPGVGPPGTIVTVTGSGFRPNTPVTVTWSTSTGSINVVADAHGDLPATQLDILTPDVLGPRYAVASSSPPASAPFLVVPSDSEPGGGSGDFLFRSEGP
jgi:hypothetical protein